MNMDGGVVSEHLWQGGKHRHGGLCAAARSAVITASERRDIFRGQLKSMPSGGPISLRSCRVVLPSIGFGYSSGDEYGDQDLERFDRRLVLQ